jgi:hypothetical protein
LVGSVHHAGCICVQHLVARVGRRGFLRRIICMRGWPQIDQADVFRGWDAQGRRPRLQRRRRLVTGWLVTAPQRRNLHSRRGSKIPGERIRTK